MKKFYKRVGVAETGGGWQVELDGRGLKTARKSPQIVPSQALAEALAREWAEQDEEIDPSRFIMRDHVDYAIDMVAPDPASAIANLIGFAETDTLCYRADPDEPFFARQQEVWEPLLDKLEAREQIRFTRVSGIIHKPQPPETLAHLNSKLAALDAFTLAPLQVMASLTASLCIALLALEAKADRSGLWEAANLEEEWQAQLWGRDPQAEQRREKRKGEFLKACDCIQLARG